MARISPLFVIPPLSFAALAAVFYFGLGGDDQLPSALIGQDAPALTLTRMETLPPITADVMADGEVKLVNFWASWCGPCRIEHPSLSGLAEEGVPVYGINYKDRATDALAFLAELGNPYTAAGADNAGRNALEWGVYGVPETFVVDGEGKILLRFAGPVTPQIVESRFRPLLDGKAE